MIETIIGFIFFGIIIIACCANDGNSSNSNTHPERNTYTPVKRKTRYSHDTYCECPSCGASYYDGYCEECGYPDINQGWLGEEY